MADAKADAVARLLAADRRELEELARNASLQLYLWQVVKARQADAAAAEPAQQAYLRNLILAAAERGGYLPDASGRVPANVPRAATSGLALFDAELNAVVVTPGLGSSVARVLATTATWRGAPWPRRPGRWWTWCSDPTTGPCW